MTCVRRSPASRWRPRRWWSRATRLAVEDERELHALIDLQVDRLTMLVNNLLDMTRIQSGALEVRPKPTSIHDLVTDTVRGCTPCWVSARWILVADGDAPLVDVDEPS